MLQKLEALRDEEKNPNMPCQQTLTWLFVGIFITNYKSKRTLSSKFLMI